jgi:hypothetical protein
MAAMLVLTISTTQLSHTNLVIADRAGNVMPSKEQASTTKVCQRPRVYLRLCGEFVVAQRASDEIARLEEELRREEFAEAAQIMCAYRRESSVRSSAMWRKKEAGGVDRDEQALAFAGTETTFHLKIGGEVRLLAGKTLQDRYLNLDWCQTRLRR